ncbi:DUF1254 domain-containing protein [Sulfurovum sp. NBC37-1]|uniref:DUF1254 domain-containing protein n=1 Tax=Sulfurovum sp. (strain NBC37-1) TaxID=387093 RepID=UPI0003267851|nr:DUF1254 domain-containing protein [Sulfurovum sp. NBC37-1]
MAKTDGKVNVLRPMRELANTDNQDVIRMNADTLYTRTILDVKGGATVTTKPYEGYQNILVLDPNHSEIATLTGAGTVKLDESMLTEGHHAYIIIRTGLLRKLPEKEMYDKAYKAQDNISVTYHSSEPYVPAVDFDLSTLDKVKYKILENFAKHPQKDVIKRGFGTLKSRDPEAAKVVIAIGWGGLSGKSAVYSSFTASGERFSYTFKKPNLRYDKKGFFSFTVYNENGYIATMKYALNSDDMVANKDGSYTVNFLASGEPKGDLQNIIVTPRGKYWTGILRCYYPVNKDETFAYADNLTAKMQKEFSK